MNCFEVVVAYSFFSISQRSDSFNLFRALDDLIEVYPEEVIHLLLCFFDKVQEELRNSNIMERVHEELSKIRYFVEDSIKRWIELGNNLISGQPLSLYQDEPKLALLWGATYCFPFLFHETGKLSLLRDLIDALDLVLQNEGGRPCAPLSLLLSFLFHAHILNMFVSIAGILFPLANGLCLVKKGQIY